MDKKIISLEIQSELREALRKWAFKNELSISKAIRKILEEKLSDEISSTQEKKDEL